MKIDRPDVDSVERIGSRVGDEERGMEQPTDIEAWKHSRPTPCSANEQRRQEGELTA